MNLHCVALSARVTLNLHSLNNEGTEGNQQQTRMVHILDANGERKNVNAVSGDMFKHILVEHVTPLLIEAGEPVSDAARRLDPDRINADAEFVKFAEAKTNKESAILTEVLRRCAVTDLAGTLVTRGRSVGRKSVVEFGWVVGLPELTVTEQYFHVKYAPEGREGAAGADTVAGRQAIFHRPASSGVYALVCNLDLYRIGLNDITREYDVPRKQREARARALVQALAATLLKPTGAQRNTQNPHITACQGALALSTNSLPAPLVSPLADNYRDQLDEATSVLNSIRADTASVRRFDTLADAAKAIAAVASEIALPE